MFGIFRLFLAVCVVFHHLASVPWVGRYAVHGFFILSGYLMTLVMHTTYGYNPRGCAAYLINRFLRLYPTYLAMLALSVVAIVVLGEDNASRYHAYMLLPKNPGDWAKNVFMFYPGLFPQLFKPKVISPSWALTVEITYYVLIGIGASRSKLMTLVWFAIGAGYMVVTHVLNLDFTWRYFNLLAASLPFSTGALLYFYKDSKLSERFGHSTVRNVSLLVFCFIANSAFAYAIEKLKLPGYLMATSYYANYVINALIVLTLAKARIAGLSRSLDGRIGDYCYPLYLLHWPAGFVCSYLLWGRPVLGPHLNGIVTMAAALALALVVAAATIRFIEQPINSLFRQRLKSFSGVTGARARTRIQSDILSDGL